MAWPDLMWTPLRVLINDVAAPQTYTDATLTQLLVTAASYVVQEVQLSTTYTVDLSTYTITPDGSADNLFINLVILKAACLVGVWDLKSRALISGFRAKLGPVDGSFSDGGSKLFDILFKEGYCGLYDRLRNEINMYGANAGNVRGVMSPFSLEEYMPFNYVEGLRL